MIAVAWDNYECAVCTAGFVSVHPAVPPSNSKAPPQPVEPNVAVVTTHHNDHSIPPQPAAERTLLL